MRKEVKEAGCQKETDGVNREEKRKRTGRAIAADGDVEKH